MSISIAGSTRSPGRDSVTAETVQSTLVGAVSGTMLGAAAGAKSGWGIMPLAGVGLVAGLAAGLGVGFARGSVDAATGDGVGPALAQTGAGLVGGALAGVGGLVLAEVIPGTRGWIDKGGGFGLIMALGVAAASVGAALVVPPILDRLG